MRVLEKVDPAEWRVEERCSSCESLLEIGVEDLKCYTYGFSLDNHEPPGGVGWTCCVCQADGYTYINKVPKSVRLRVDALKPK